jgi:protein disulfide-isomerase
MKKFLLALFACLAAGQVVASDANWLVSLPQAMDQAKNDNKIILLDFTGSDWCGWCKKLDADIFSKSEFTDYAAKNLVLVQVDFPRQRTQPIELHDANKALQTKYEVKGFPTLVALKSDGTVLWKQTGYLTGGPKALITKLDEVIPKPFAPVTAAPPMPPSPNSIPTQWPAPPARVAGDEPRLQAIFYSSSHPCVILEGQSCEEGDSVEGMRVLKIARDKVTVQWNGQTKDLRMKSAVEQTSNVKELRMD